MDIKTLTVAQLRDIWDFPDAIDMGDCFHSIAWITFDEDGMHLETETHIRRSFGMDDEVTVII